MKLRFFIIIILPEGVNYPRAKSLLLEKRGVAANQIIIIIFIIRPLLNPVHNGNNAMCKHYESDVPSICKNKNSIILLISAVQKFSLISY